jgi:photosystem II stability/assembly factor-like uncharacterized protein
MQACWLATHAAAAHAQPDAPTWAVESAQAGQRLLLDVAQAGARWVAVGDRGHILYSDNQGRDWTQARVPTRQMLTAVHFVDARHGWAVGHDTQILASVDGGSHWTRQHLDLDRQAPLLDVWFENAERGWAVGAYGALLATEDGGAHWRDVSERLDNDEQLHLNAIARVKGAGLVIVGEQGALFRSADAGASWQRLPSPYPGSLFGVIGTARPRGVLAFGLRGTLLRSEDFGEHWQSIAPGGPGGAPGFALNGASLLADGTLVLVGNGGSILRSHDDGRTFSLLNRPDRLALSAVAGSGDGSLLLVGQGGVQRMPRAQGARP